MASCSHCGTAIVADAAEPSAEVPAGREAERLFVDLYYDFIRQSWDRAEHRPLKLGWSWSAFLFSFLWLGYRKMYQQAWCVMSIVLMLDAGFRIMLADDFRGMVLAQSGVRLFFAILLGALGMRLYQWHVKRRIADIQARYEPEQAWAELARQGSTNLWAVFGLLFFFFALSLYVIPLMLYPLSA